MTYSTVQQDPRWQRRKDERPAEIIDAALQLFVERGYAATRLTDIARAAGISKGSLYRYFESKDALFKAMVKQVVIPELEKAEMTANAYQGDISSLIRHMVVDWWETMGESRICGIPKLIIAEASNFPELAEFYVNEVIKRVRKLVAGIIERGIRTGEFRADISAEYAARLLISPIVFAAIWNHSLAPFDEPYDVRTYLRNQTDIFIRGLQVEE
ncbi:MAG: TetR/AcrR family transcriptional regulator [Thioalkalispiraceae bacterium]|jgi:AcrR family transcriptional regulator